MNFNDIVYERVDYNSTKNEFIKIVNELNKCTNFNNYKILIDKINNIRSHIKTMSTYTTIMFSINTKDKFYLEEKKYWDEYLPLYEKLDNIYYKALKKTIFKDEFIDTYGEFYFKYINTCIDSFDDSIVELLQQENKLMSEYTSLLASYSCDFYGEKTNLFGLTAYFGILDDNKRIEAINLHTRFFEENEEKFDNIFDKLVKIRNSIALKLGYDNFIKVGYNRMHRTDYDEDMVSNLRKNIIKNYLHKVNKIYNKQAKRIGVNNIDYFNENILFKDGNPKLICDDDRIIECGKNMYHNMSEETSEFIDFLLKNNLFHVKKSENKSMGGYCTILYDYKEPFIFGNFNGTLDDVDTLTHEFGHAFQVYMSRHESIPELIFPTLDSCEIYSMSMEFLTYPWMENFFGKDNEKYKISHYESFLKFLPYGCLVDHFQHEIYSKPELTPDERKSLWRDLEQIYCPHRNYGNEDSILNRGGYWFRQGHIFKNPFYYIDYVLAEFCALELKKIMDEDYEKAWRIYVEISKLGGRYSFIDIIKTAGFNNPFEISI